MDIKTPAADKAAALPFNGAAPVAGAQSSAGVVTPIHNVQVPAAGDPRLADAPRATHRETQSATKPQPEDRQIHVEAPLRRSTQDNVFGGNAVDVAGVATDRFPNAVATIAADRTLGWFRQRERQVREAFRRDPLTSAAHTGRLLRTLGRFEDAERVLRWGLRENPENSPHAYACRNELALLLLCSGPDRLDAALELAQDLSPEDAELLLGVADEMRGKPQDLPDDEPDRSFVEFSQSAYAGQTARAIECLTRVQASLKDADPENEIELLADLIQGPAVWAIQNDPLWRAHLMDLSMAPDVLASIDFALPREIPSLASLRAASPVDPNTRRLREMATAKFGVELPVWRRCATLRPEAHRMKVGQGHHHAVFSTTVLLADGSPFDCIYKKPMSYWWGLCNFAASELDQLMGLGVIARTHLVISEGDDKGPVLGIAMARAVGTRPMLVGNMDVVVPDEVAKVLLEQPQLLAKFAREHDYREASITGNIVHLARGATGEHLPALDFNDPDLRCALNTLEWFDALLMNWDRHGGNWHVGRDSTGRLRVTGIDNDRAFAPNGFMALPEVIERTVASKFLSLGRKELDEAFAALPKDVIDRVDAMLARIKRTIASFSEDQLVDAGARWSAPGVTRRLGIGQPPSDSMGYLARMYYKKQQGEDDGGERAEQLTQLAFPEAQT